MFPMMHSRFLLICCVTCSVIWTSSAYSDCGEYERPVECIDQCQRCEYKNGGCAQPAVCIPGCDCIPGFFRNKQNQCIPAAFCPAPKPTQQCGVYEIPVKCIDQCQTCQYKNGNCTQGAVCIPGCDCIPGFFRNQQKQCMPAHLCPGPTQQCPAGEIPVKCIDRCQRCEYKNGNCTQIGICTPGCNCVPGFLRNSTNKCIPRDFCPGPTQQCPAGEIPVKCIDRCQRCEYKNGNCTQIGICTPGCNCVPGFLRDSTNKCIPRDFCPGSTQQCPAGEIPVKCIDRCQRCEYKNGNCTQIGICTPGCNCVPGFLRDSTNKCIPRDFCPDQCKSDEQYYPDIPDCKNTCEYINNPGTICPKYIAPRPGCFCKKGLVKRKDGKCVKPENCGPPGFPCSLEVDAGPCYGYFPRFYFNKKTGKCEKFIYGGCEGNANNFEDKKICEIVCKGTGPGPAQQCPAGEIPVGCIDRCQRCEYKNGNCSQIQVCTPGCNCVPGFLRDSTNKCIPADFCPGTGPGPAQQCPAGEIPGCIDRCQRCEYKNGNCAQAQVCTPGCNCLPGFLRDSTNKCIPANFCPGTGPGPAQQCPAGEIPGCIDRCQRCEFKNGNCAQIQVCTPGCNCLPGFLRDSTNKCIPANFCPDQCKSDEQYYPDIPDCKNTCEYINNPGTICPKYIAPRPGCFCKKGLVKRKDGKCVKPENCGPPGFPCLLEVDAGPCHGNFPRFYFNKKTGKCEKFIYGGCEGNANNFEDKKICEIVCKGPPRPQQCPAGEIPVKCIDRCQRCEYKNGNCSQIQVCTPGCNCVPGFLRDSTNKCIPADFCPGTGPGPAQQCPAGEIPGCLDRCQRCEFKNGNCAQIQVCTPGCNCLPGFLRDSTNKCIPANFCPDQCKSDEQYYPDIPDCKNTCKYINNPGTICPQYFAPRPGCFCKKGLVKRKDGKCVKPENCGPPGFPCSLEVDAGPCYGYFPRFYFNKKTGKCEKFIYGGCEGNANNFEDKKICEIVCKGTGPGPAQQCPAGEIPVGCIDRCQRCEYKNGNCSQIQVCTPGCNCVPGFLRDSTNKCIPADFCPGNKPNKPCLQEKDPGPCRAYIKRFYYNKKTGECEEFIYGGCKGNANNFVDKKLCEAVCKVPIPTQQCGQYERPVECIDQCQTCKYKNGGCVAQTAVCIPGCDCIPGFFRNERKQCIPAALCPGTGPGPAQQCPAYEYPVPCIDRCQTCEYKNGYCGQGQACTPGCNCVPGFLRDKTKKCIPASRCP